MRSFNAAFGPLPLALCLLLGCTQPEAAVRATVKVTEEVVVENPQRLGVTLGETNYYGDEQYVANPFSHGGFEQGRQAYGFRAINATANTVTDENTDPNDPDRTYTETFSGGTYTIATGARAGETGRITDNPPRTGVFTLDKSGPPVADGDFVWVHGPLAPRAVPDGNQGEPFLGIADFRVLAEEGVTHDFVPDPENPRNQVLRFTVPIGGTRVYCGFKHYIKATPNTTYRVRFRALSTLPKAELSVEMLNLGMSSDQPGHTINFSQPQAKALSGQWSEYGFEGKTYSSSTIAEKFSQFSITVSADASTKEQGFVYFDDVMLENDAASTDSGFSRPVVDTLKEAQCGVLRFYGPAGLGSLVESMTAKNTTQAPWTFLSLASFFRFEPTDSVVDQWMMLSKEVGAAPWITVGSANTPDDWYRLISYLAAPSSFDADAGRRADHGHAAPWTDQFDTIYLEIGNEWWNSIFSPYYIYDPAKYGELCRTVLQRIQQHPHFDKQKIQIIAGGWAINAHHWNQIVDKGAEGIDRVSLAPYLAYELDQADTLEQKYLTFFADVDAYAQGPGRAIVEEMAGNGKNTGLAVYELNTHSTTGDASAEAVSEIAPSTAAGIAVLDQAMSLMANLKANPINYFTLLQRSYDDRLGLWGCLVRDPNGSLRPRPIWQGLRLANQFLIDGAMVKAEVVEGPTWDQPENGSVPEMSGVPEVHAYAFRPAADKLNVLIVHRNLEQGIRVQLELPFTPAPNVKSIVLTSPEPGDNNEQQEVVKLREQNISNFNGVVTVPACAAVVYQFSAS